jgi:hypothetical protein
MNMRIAKYKPFGGVGCDGHGKLPPTLTPPVPPAVGPPVPTGAWVHLIVNPFPGWYLTGKYTMESVQTEGMGHVLWQYDWGPLQPHIPITPPYLTPSLALVLLSSSAKYWLPSFKLQNRVDGASMATISAKANSSNASSPVAINLCPFLTTLETCWDKSSAVSFNLPTGVCFHSPNTHWIDFNGCDFAAGLIGLLTDALSAACLSFLGGKILKGFWDNMIFGALANSALGFLVSLSPVAIGFGGGGVVFDGGIVAVAAGSTVGGCVAIGAGGAAMINFFGNNIANEVGQSGQPPAPASGNQTAPSSASGGSAPQSSSPQSGASSSSPNQSSSSQDQGGTCDPNDPRSN